MTMTIDDMVSLAKQIEYDLSVTRTRVSQLREALSRLPSPPAEDLRCDLCGVSHRSYFTLSEHRYYTHAGPVPEHYLEAEQRAGFDNPEQGT